MTDQTINEMITAFSTGCMDRKNFEQFKNYMQSGGSLPRTELGEIQNIVSMIPVILELETPDAALKDNVAKKLISMQDEIKAKIKEEKLRTKATFAEEPGLPAGSLGDFKSTAKPFTGVKTFQMPDAPVITKVERTTPLPEDKPASTAVEEARRTATRHTEENPPALFPPQQNLEAEKYFPPEKSPGSVPAYIAIILSIILFSILGYYIFSTDSGYETEIQSLKDELASLKSDFNTTQNFVATYSELIEFFNRKDLAVLMLESSDPNVTASAKLLFAPNDREALLQLSNVPSLTPNLGYQLWLVSKGQTYSLGVYNPTPNEKYIKIQNMPYIPKSEIDLFKITIEPASGSATPSGQVYLQGSLSQPARR